MIIIPYNKVEGLEWKRPSITRQNKFVQILKDANVSVTIRREKAIQLMLKLVVNYLKKGTRNGEQEPSPSSPFIKPNIEN